MTMRTHEVQQSYEKAMKDGSLIPLYEETAVKDFKYWKIVENRWPHDRWTEKNDLLVLKRKAMSLMELKLSEAMELLEIFTYELHPMGYHTAPLNLGSISSVKDVPHFHLYVLKPGLT